MGTKDTIEARKEAVNQTISFLIQMREQLNLDPEIEGYYNEVSKTVHFNNDRYGFGALGNSFNKQRMYLPDYFYLRDKFKESLETLYYTLEGEREKYFLQLHYKFSELLKGCNEIEPTKPSEERENHKERLTLWNEKVKNRAIFIRHIKGFQTLVNEYIHKLENESLPIEKTLKVQGLPEFNLAERYFIANEKVNLSRWLDRVSLKKDKNKLLAIIMGCSVDNAKQLINGTYRPLNNITKERENELKDFIDKIEGLEN